MKDIGAIATSEIYRELITRFSEMIFDTAHTTEEVRTAAIIKLELRRQVDMLSDRQYSYRR